MFLFGLREDWHLIALSNNNVNIGQRDLSVVHGLLLKLQEIVLIGLMLESDLQFAQNK